MASPKIVLANGCFDLFHIGHLRYLEEAKMMGDILLVSVTRNAFVNKGWNRPIYDEQDRLDVVAAQRCVDHAFLVNGAAQALLSLPHIFVKGREYEGKIEPLHQAFCDKHDIEIRFTDTEEIRPNARLRQG